MLEAIHFLSALLPHLERIGNANRVPHTVLT
jgi:hypothetical protein